MLQSQPYDNAKDRNKGLNSVFKHASGEEYYKITSLDDGSHVVKLFASNGEEIARSPIIYASKSQEFINQCKQEIPALRINATEESSPEVPVNVTSTKLEYATDGKTDNYKRLSFYESELNLSINGYQKFEKEEEHYFALISNDKVLLISEGYETEEECDDGIKSVKENLPHYGQYDIRVNQKDKHYFNLKAKNNAEVATSAWFDTKSELDQAINLLAGMHLSEMAIQSSPEENLILGNTNDELRLEEVVALEEEGNETDESDVYESNVNELISVTKSELSFTDNYLPVEMDEEPSTDDLETPDSAESLAYHEAEKELLSAKVESELQPESIEEVEETEISVAANSEIESTSAILSNSSIEKETKDGISWWWLLLLLPLLFAIYKSCGSSNKKAAENSIEKNKVDTSIDQTEETKKTPLVQKEENSSTEVEVEVESEPETTSVLQKNEDDTKTEISVDGNGSGSSSNTYDGNNPRNLVIGDDFVSKLDNCLNNSDCALPLAIQWTGPAFEYNESKISLSADASLEKLAGIMKEHPKLSLKVFGHVASNEDNYSLSDDDRNRGVNSLSELRAKNIYDKLIGLGLAKDRISHGGMGFDYPLTTDNIAPGHRCNKRIEMIFTK